MPLRVTNVVLLLTIAALLETSYALGQPNAGLTLTTSAFDDGGIIPSKYTAAAPGAPFSPVLTWMNVPAGTVSFALLLHDPDTSVDKTTTEILHWMVFNIQATTRELSEGVPARMQLPDGAVQGRNYSGKVGYIGMGAPAPGPYHHYTFELFALDTKLSLGPSATEAEVLKAMDGHVLAKGVLVGRFHLP
jgi:Raf kinase inhibitor-like YbhB/YbcL family protein